MPPSDAPWPDFIVGGAPRSGTTSLAQALDGHPDIEMAKPLIPESKVFMSEAGDGAEGYLARYRALFADASGARLRGEKTSYYLENEDAFRRIRATFAHMRFIFIVREPVSRAYSNYLWSCDNGIETLAFEDAVEREGARASPLAPDKAYARPFDYLVRGDYGTFAARYIEAFGRDNVAFYLYEEMLHSPKSLLVDVQGYLGVEAMALTDLLAFTANVTDRRSAPLDTKLEARLRERLRPQVIKFAEVTGMDIGPWGY